MNYAFPVYVYLDTREGALIGPFPTREDAKRYMRSVPTEAILIDTAQALSPDAEAREGR